MAQGNVIGEIAVPSYGTVYVLTNVSGKRIAGAQFSLPVMDPGESVSIPENKLKPAHASLVDAGILSASPRLPSNLAEIARSIIWQDVAWQRFRDEQVASELSVFEDQTFLSAPSPGPYTSGTPERLVLELRDEDAAPITSDSESTIDIVIVPGTVVINTLNEGKLVAGALGTPGPITVQFASGKIDFEVDAPAPAAGPVTVNVGNPAPNPALAVPPPLAMNWV